MLVPNPPRRSLWRQETLHLARSGLTLAFNQLLQIAIPFVTTSMTGRLGVEALAAGSLVGSIGLLLFISSLGVMQGLVPLISIAIGAGDEHKAARVIRGGLAAALAMGVVATVIMACVPWALAHTGQDPALVALAQRFIVAMLPSYLPGIVAIALRFFLIAANDLKWLNPIIIGGIAFNIGCNVLLSRGAFGFDGLTAVGLTISLTNWLMFGCLALTLARAKRIPHSVRDWRAGFGGARGARARHSRRRDFLHRDAAVCRFERADGLFRQSVAGGARHRAAVAEHCADDADRFLAGGDGACCVPVGPA